MEQVQEIDSGYYRLVILSSIVIIRSFTLKVGFLESGCILFGSGIKKLNSRFLGKMVTKTSVDLEKNDVEQHILCKFNCHHCYI